MQGRVEKKGEKKNNDIGREVCLLRQTHFREDVHEGRRMLAQENI